MLLVTGAGGQVGRRVAVEARRRGIPCIALDRARLDVADAAAVDSVFDAAAGDFRVVLNLAAYTRVDDAERQPEAAFAANAHGVENLARACSRTECSMLHVSTDYVFDGSAARPCREDDAVHPLNAYGRSKAAGEDALRALLPHHVIVRTSWVFGADGGNFTATMLRLAAQRGEVRVVADEIGCPTPATDLAGTLVTLATSMARPDFDGWGTYHYSGRPAVSRANWARAIFAAARRVGGLPIANVMDIPSHEFPTPATRPTRVVLDCTRIERLLGIAQPDWEAAIDPMLREIRAREAAAAANGPSRERS